VVGHVFQIGVLTVSSVSTKRLLASFENGKEQVTY
jgi:hypothetical protein